MLTRGGVQRRAGPGEAEQAPGLERWAQPRCQQETRPAQRTSACSGKAYHVKLRVSRRVSGFWPWKWQEPRGISSWWMKVRGLFWKHRFATRVEQRQDPLERRSATSQRSARLVSSTVRAPAGLWGLHASSQTLEWRLLQQSLLFPWHRQAPLPAAAHQAPGQPVLGLCDMGYGGLTHLI